MSTLVVFHSALGLRPSVVRFADRLRAAGHEVHTPDLYDGEVFDDLAVGEAKRDAIGVPTLVERAMAAVEPLGNDLIYVGFSMGTAPAQLLAATRPGALGAVLLHGALPFELCGLDAWPSGVPVQLHVTAEDPWVDADGLASFVQAVPAGRLDHHVYPGSAHLFTDENSSEYDERAAERLFWEVARFVDEVADRPAATGGK